MRCFMGKRKKPLFVCQNQRFLVNNKLYLIVNELSLWESWRASA